MVSVSLCMIVKDEEETIGRCLDSVRHLVDEIVIVDTGSTDRTKDRVRQYTDRIYDFQWIDDFAAARNYSFQQATQDYIFWLDADDVLLKEDQEKFAKLKATLSPHIDAVTMDYHLAFDEHGNVTFRTKRHRLVRRERRFRWVGAVHEYLEVGGHIFHSDVAVTHLGTDRDPDRNLKIYEKRLARGETFSPRDLYYFANELSDHRQLERAVYYYEKFLDTKKGWLEDNIAACGKLADCYFQLGEPEKAFRALLRSLVLTGPGPKFAVVSDIIFFKKATSAPPSSGTNWPPIQSKPSSKWGLSILLGTRGFLICNFVSVTIGWAIMKRPTGTMKWPVNFGRSRRKCCTTSGIWSPF